MEICGIAAEYNPFHKGHLHQFHEIRRVLGDDALIVCAMSGNFVQRGDFAILEKYKRAEAAVRCGADLVIELPLTAALSSAEGFARGAVGTLKAVGCTKMSFGAETPDKALFLKSAMLLESISKGNSGKDKKNLSYAANRQEELKSLDASAAMLLDSPNNTLGAEYCRFMHPMEPLPVLRKGAPHDSKEITEGYTSAGYIRKKVISEGLMSSKGLLPAPSFEVFQRAVLKLEAPVECPDAVLLGILRRLLYENGIDTGSGGGFDGRIRKAVYKASSFKEAVLLAATKRFPMSRIRRELLKLILGIPKDYKPEPEYLRILAIGKHGPELIKKASLPVIVKPVTEKKHEYDVFRDMLRLDLFSDDLFALAYPGKEKKTGGSHFSKTPTVYLK